MTGDDIVIHVPPARAVASAGAPAVGSGPVTDYAVKTPDFDGTRDCTREQVQEIVRAYRDEHGEGARARDVSVHAMTGQSHTGQPLDPLDFL